MLPVQMLEWNRTEVDYPRDSTIAEQFEQQVAKSPDAIAIVANDIQLSYRELDERSNRIARHLQTLGVKPDTLVGVAMGRSETLVVCLLAILKAGGAYVPLDPTHPKERLCLVINDSEMEILLTTSEMRERLPLDAGGVTVLDVENSAAAFESTDTVETNAASHNLAYVIYTSGSTGKPKGVMVENRNVVNFFSAMDRAIGCAPGVWLAVTSFSFDISVLELLWTLTRGFKVVVHGDEGTATIADEITRHEVTHLQMTPSLARMLTLDARAFIALGLLKQVLLGGETVPASLIHHIRQIFSGEIHNMYGPTETTIWSTTYRVEEPGRTVSIGRPISNTQIYLLDAELQPVPVGEIGELFIGGDGVARGYWNRPDLTAERFLTIPSLSPNRIYRTGDIARFLPDGNIEFLGRADYQVKLRGHRIEPGEIEAILEQCGVVRQAVVVVREDKEGDKRLVAYLVIKETEVEVAGMLRSMLASKLPDYMIPSAFVFLPELPLTDNGKIDRKALLKLPPPNVTLSADAGPRENESGQQANNEIERIVAAAWQDALGITSVGMNDNFFDLGAHSLTVAEVKAKLQEALGREISLLDLFQFSTVSTLAGHLAGTQWRLQVSDRAQRRRLARQP
ncbi:non-ribosomal peptide synthetase [Edaphobacter paludis]|uniref:Non-ribosomal peptide synthetase n=1 Tax=Edaphobacter paludis TaxID=3035702 RepID=A0AAU7D088_9BACT